MANHFKIASRSIVLFSAFFLKCTFWIKNIVLEQHVFGYHLQTTVVRVIMPLLQKLMKAFEIQIDSTTVN